MVRVWILPLGYLARTLTLILQEVTARHVDHGDYSSWLVILSSFKGPNEIRPGFIITCLLAWSTMWVRIGKAVFPEPHSGLPNYLKEPQASPPHPATRKPPRAELSIWVVVGTRVGLHWSLKRGLLANFRKSSRMLLVECFEWLRYEADIYFS